MSRPLRAALALYVAAGAAIVLLYRDAYSQDGGLHFLLARWSWEQPETFVSVWQRPGFNLVYALPARLGYLPAKFLTVLLTAAAAAQTAGAARALGLERPWLAAPMLLASPVLFLLSTETMTEPLFALAIATALRLHLEGRRGAALLVASLFPTLRPEGFVLCALWGLWALAEPRPLVQRLLRPFVLAAGTALWWAAAWALSGDPLYLAHHWPWSAPPPPSTTGLRGLLRYPLVSPLIVGPVLLPFVLAGAWLFLRERRWLPLSLAAVSVAFFTFLTWRDLHDIAGRTRYLAPMVPVFALFALRAWNAARLSRFSAAALFSVSFGFAFGAVDLSPTNRDWKAFDRTIDRVPPPDRLVASQMYAYVRLGRPPGELPFVRDDRPGNLRRIREIPPGTLVLWDDTFGPWYFAIRGNDFLEAGFRLVRGDVHDLPPLAPWPDFLQDWTGRRRLTIWAYRRDPHAGAQASILYGAATFSEAIDLRPRGTRSAPKTAPGSCVDSAVASRWRSSGPKSLEESRGWSLGTWIAEPRTLRRRGLLIPEGTPVTAPSRGSRCSAPRSGTGAGRARRARAGSPGGRSPRTAGG